MRLITKSDIDEFREISRGVKDKKINPFIDDAQFQDLRPLMGDRFYNDFIVNVEENQDYEDLFNGGKYEYKDSEYFNPGVKRVLSIYARARYMLFGSFTDTAFGFVEKSNQDSKPVSDSAKRNIYTQEQNTAFNYWLEVEAFLNRNIDRFPKWRNDSCSPKIKRFRISKIS